MKLIQDFQGHHAKKTEEKPDIPDSFSSGIERRKRRSKTRLPESIRKKK